MGVRLFQRPDGILGPLSRPLSDFYAAFFVYFLALQARDFEEALAARVGVPAAGGVPALLRTGRVGFFGAKGVSFAR